MQLTNAQAVLGSALLGTAGSFAGGFIGNSQSWKNTRRAMELAYNLNQQSLLQSPSNARKGLENAGYNPILAINSGMNTPFVQGSNTTSGDFSSLGDISSNLANAYQTFQLNKQSVNNQSLSTLAGVENSNAQASLFKEQAITEQAKRNRLDVQNRLDEINTQISKGHLDNETKRVLLDEKYGLMNAQANIAQASASQLNAQANLKNSQTNALQFENTMEANRLNSDWIKRHPHQASWLVGINNWTKSISPWTTGHTVINRYDSSGNFKGQTHKTTGRGRARR